MAGYQELTFLSDVELLARLCSDDEDSALYEEFVKRFLPELTAECQRISSRRKLDQQIGTQIAHECFEKVRKYKSFKVDEIKIRDSHKAILVYLFRIAGNLFNDQQRCLVRKEAVVVNKTYFDNLFEDEGQEKDPETLQKIKDKTLAVLKKLNTREQRVLLTDLDYKRTYRYLPDDVNEILATELGVKKDTIRKIRERAIVKIKKAINEAEEI